MKRKVLTRCAMLALGVPLILGAAQIGNCGLNAEDFTPIATGGVDNWINSYPWAMEQFDGDDDGTPEIYIGTAQHALCIQVPRMDFLLTLDPNFVPPTRWKCPNHLWDPNDQSAFNAEVASHPAHVFRGTYDEPNGAWIWEHAWDPDPNLGEPRAFRGARVFNDAMYFGGSQYTGAILYKSTDGQNFVPASPAGMGIGALCRGLRAMTVYKGKLYVASDTLGLIWCSDNPSTDPNSWEQACNTGFMASGGGSHEDIYYTGNLDSATANTLTDDVLAPLPNGSIAGWTWVRVTSAADPNIVQERRVIYNTTNGVTGTVYVKFGASGQAFDPVPEPNDPYEIYNPIAADNKATWQMAEFNGYLWAAPFNSETGPEIWKSDNPAPGNWTKVVEGGYGNEITQGYMTMRAFGDHLYLGTVVYPPNVDGFEDFQGTEIIRIDKNDNVEVLVGMTRDDPNWPGTNNGEPLSGLGLGFDYMPNVYCWYTAEHDGWFYVGTYDMGGMILDIIDEMFPGGVPPEYQTLLDLMFGPDELRRGGFDLWRTRDGIAWVPVVLDGFGDHDNYGIRNMLSTQWGFVIGVANAVDGFEVYLGSKP